MAGMLNVLERNRDRIMADSQEFITEFGTQYAKQYGSTLFDKVKKDVEGKKVDPRALQYRKFTEVERELRKGSFNMKSGMNQGDFGSWKTYYFAENKDYTLSYYDSEKSFAGGKKPIDTINFAGYKFTYNPSSHYGWEIWRLARDMGETNEPAVHYSPYTWAMTHFNRTNYLFQFHKGKNPACACLPFGNKSMVEPDDGSETSSEGSYWRSAMEDMASKCTARDKCSTTGKAFQKTVKQLSNSIYELWWFEDDGTEEQILKDMLVKKVIDPSIKNDLLNEGRSLPMLPLKMKMWFKTLTATNATLQKALSTAWPTVTENIKQQDSKLEPKIRQGVDPILKVKKETYEKLKNATSTQLNDSVAKFVVPAMDPVMKAILGPVEKGFQSVEKIFSSTTAKFIEKGDSTYQGMVQELDKLPRSWDLWREIYDAASELMDPVRALAKSNAEIFEHIDAWRIRDDAIALMLETLDAAGYSFQLKTKAHFKIDAANQAAPLSDSHALQTIKDDIIKRLQHDIQLGKNTFIKRTIQDASMNAFSNTVDPLVKEVLGPIDSAIPDSANGIISARAEFDNLKDATVKEPIGKFIDGAIHLPQPITAPLIAS